MDQFSQNSAEPLDDPFGSPEESYQTLFEDINGHFPSRKPGRLFSSSIADASLFSSIDPNSPAFERVRYGHDQVRQALRDPRPKDLDAVVYFIQECEAMIEFHKAQAESQLAAARVYQARANDLKTLLDTALGETGRKAADGFLYRVGVVEREFVDVDGDADLESLAASAPELVRVKLSPDKPAIRKAIRAGAHIPGCSIEMRRHLKIESLTGAATAPAPEQEQED